MAEGTTYFGRSRNGQLSVSSLSGRWLSSQESVGKGSNSQATARWSNREGSCRRAADTNLQLLVAERAHAAQTLIG